MKTLTRARATRAVLRASIAFLVLLASTIFSVFALSQDKPLTRQQEWREQLEAKSKSLKPYQPGSLEDVRLLRIKQEEFYDLLSDHIKITQSVFKALVQHIKRLIGN